MVLRAGTLLMQSCFLRENMRNDLFPKCNKMRKENKTTSHQFLFKLLLHQTLWPKASCPSERFHSHPPVAFFFFFGILQGGSFHQLHNGAEPFLLVSLKKKATCVSITFGEREVISEQLHLWEPASRWKIKSITSEIFAGSLLRQLLITKIKVLLTLR